MAQEALNYESDNNPQNIGQVLYTEGAELFPLREFSRYRDVRNNDEIIALGLQDQIKRLENFFWPILRASFKIAANDYEQTEFLRERLIQAEVVLDDFNRLICSSGCSQELLDLFELAYMKSFRRIRRKLFPDSELFDQEEKVVSATPIEKVDVSEPKESFIKRNRLAIALCAALVVAGGSFAALHSMNDSNDTQRLGNAISFKNE
ncbi:hypothetical protein ACFL3C_02245 [Patescibacteria group bacterium]